MIFTMETMSLHEVYWSCLRYRLTTRRVLIYVFLFVALWPSALLAQDRATVRFESAIPIWPEGREREMNLLAGFRAVFDTTSQSSAILRIAAASLYRVYVNGRFCGHGPARGPHGYFRVDEWDLSPYLNPGRNLAAIEVAGYNVNSYYLLDQPSFLQAEVVSRQQVLASTAGSGVLFEATLLPERVQKVQRYSFQRPFSEYYRLKPDYDAWKMRPDAPFAAVKYAFISEKRLLPRRISYPRFVLRQPQRRLIQGGLVSGNEVRKPWEDRSLTSIGPELKGFREEDLEVTPSLALQKINIGFSKKIDLPYSWEEQIRVGESAYEILDLGVNLTGFLGARVTCRKKTRFFLTFDEILSNNDVDFKRLSTVNIIGYELEPGNYSIESCEPYTLRYLKLMVVEGECEFSRIYLREYANPDVEDSHFASSDERLNRLFAAGKETFRQNAVDLFMDCPSRERAGWLCDSYFTSRVAQLLSGHERIEKNFFENFLVPAHFEHLPEGMVPMCYPADHYDGNFIPNWALWFILQLEEYQARSGDREMIEALRPRVLKILEYFHVFRNQDGLLERLKGWVFVEWSAANDYVQDVNYPSNMLYAAALAAAGRLYGLPQFLQEAQQIQDKIRKESFNGEFFIDNSVRQDGKLKLTKNCSEVCQYFAFYFDVASPESHPALWHILRDEFGPRRKQTDAYPNVKPANAFVGDVLRLEILSRCGLSQQLLDESVDYLLYMADRTGTLWENDSTVASCNHGFASHIIKNLYRDVLGVRSLDLARKEVGVYLTDLHLTWCEGIVPGPDGPVTVKWRKEGDQLFCWAEAPAGYRVKVENHSSLRLVLEP
jgi:alpha-L-rhamnosidase